MIDTIRIVKPSKVVAAIKINRAKQIIFTILEDLWIEGTKIDPWDPRLCEIRNETLALLDMAEVIDNGYTLALIHF